ncbi:uncharacterized protein LOC122012895 [Zingiber officinale]|uniref:DUF1639 family protein n=1 Tax=Zingiber officinale TaxID=94328 RepID=A0A8J5FGU5_ZINOF|nr:uncharacterized protein LOC122012895 [Zingiber officinale]KAG6488094.1 hypothetical protein ZIOFF_056852 [Zingiber officinale]
MVTSAETSPRPPDPAPVPAPAAREATPPRPQAPASLLPTPSLPILKSWGSRRVLPCVSVNGKGEIAGGGRRKTAEHDEEKTGRRRTVVEDDGGDDDPRIEEVREKLLLHLREAADRMNLVSFLPVDGIGGREPVPVPEPAAIAEHPAADASEEPAAPRWNLRTRRRAPRSPTGNHQYLTGSLPVTRENKAVRLRSEDQEQPKRLKFSVSLTKEEIDEDLYSMTGSRARRRPRRRPRAIQKQLDSLFPGSWLSEITADSYKVPDEK